MCGSTEPIIPDMNKHPQAVTSPQSTVLVRLAKALYESDNWAARPKQKKERKTRF